MSAVLLDTNALVWLVADPNRIRTQARDQLADPSTDLVVSAATAWELAIKTRSGRIAGVEAIVSGWDDTLARVTATELPIAAADAIMAGSLPWSHADPFDRMLIAQAARRGYTIASSDALVLDGALSPVLDTRPSRNQKTKP